MSQKRLRIARTRRKRMWAINHSDLPFFIQNERRITGLWLVPITNRGSRWYQLELEVQGMTDRGHLLSLRKKPRAWSSLNKAMEFIEEHFADIPQVTVVTGPPAKRPKKRGRVSE